MFPQEPIVTKICYYEIMSKVLVTGGAGFIGTHVVKALQEGEDEVVVVDSFVAQVHTLPREHEIDYVCDLAHTDQFPEFLDGVDEVVHLAAEVGVGQSMYEISRFMESNTMGTARLLEYICNNNVNIKRFIVASSMSIYGEGKTDILGNPMPTDETKLLEPASPYAISKIDQEMLTLALCKAHRIPAMALRFFNVYGPGQALSNPYTGVGAIFSARLLNDQPPIIFEDGNQLRDFIHVSDITRAVLLALDSRATGAINIGTGIPVSIYEVAKVIAEQLGKDINPIITGMKREGDIRQCYAATNLAESLIGFRAEVPFVHGVADLVRWVETQKAVDKVLEAMAELNKYGLVSAPESTQTPLGH